MPYLARLLIRDVVTASGTDTVRSAAKRMKTAGIGCIVVAQGGKPVGIFTERDLLNKVVAQELDPDRTALSQVMTPNPVMVDAAEPLNRVFSALAKRKFRHLPITDGGKLAGIVSLSDLAKVLEDVYREDKYIQYFVDYLQQDSAPAAS